jgi:hypothetical protein
MARADLSAMLGRLDDEPTPPPKSGPAKQAFADQATKEKTQGRKPRATGSTANTKPVPRKASPAAPAVVSSPNPVTQGPLFSRLERKETRLRPDQYAALTTHARRLSQAKQTGGERITENTLIRVAIDLLLERADTLTGQTEEDIKNSATL